MDARWSDNVGAVPPDVSEGEVGAPDRPVGSEVDVPPACGGSDWGDRQLPTFGGPVEVKDDEAGDLAGEDPDVGLGVALKPLFNLGARCRSLAQRRGGIGA